MKVSIFFKYLLCISLLFSVFIESKAQGKVDKIAQKITKKGQFYCANLPNTDSLKMDTVIAFKENKKFVIQLNTTAAYSPLRESSILDIEKSLRSLLPKKYKKWGLDIRIDSLPIRDYIPNYYRKESAPDPQRLYYQDLSYSHGRSSFLIRKQDESAYNQALSNHYIALWHSHGLYYDIATDTWLWQRPALYGTIEDLFPMTFVLPYLAPMLENAGALTFIPRERDWNSNEVIVDQDGSTLTSSVTTQGAPWVTQAQGFKMLDVLYTGVNPFQEGSYSRMKAEPKESSRVIYLPDVPETGDYAVYLSWKQDETNVSDAKYTINYSGGSVTLNVNQKIGGGTWIYAGKYHFLKGKNEESGSVILSNESAQLGYVSSDAVRLGGGYGHVARQASEHSVYQTSKHPSYLEGARYYLQYAGAPDSLVYFLSKNKKNNDYTDDYQSRGKWVNYLRDSLNIPIDFSLAFHTDAGMSLENKSVGTLLIYSTAGDSTKCFSNGVSRMANRDVADLVQTQIVDDIQGVFGIQWNHRGMWDKKYSEAKYPDVPAILLELLSHQNMADALLGQDPKFKFTVSRAIYKGLLRFICNQENRDYVVQPLPVTHMRIEKQSHESIRISWKPQVDSLESSAIPTSYRLYISKGEAGFDQGYPVLGSDTVLSLSKDSIYRFKVCAVNEGGLSFPSEILSAYLGGGNRLPVAIVNGFDRVSAPDYFSSNEYAGIPNWLDQGVPDKENIGYVGDQYNFNKHLPNDPTKVNEAWGSAYTNEVGKIIPGNTFDFPYVHGRALKALGYSFISMSQQSFCENVPQNTLAIDLILGKQRTSYNFYDSTKQNPQYRIYTPALREALKTYLAQNGALFLSGAYVGTDARTSSESYDFVKNELHFTPHSDRAAKNGLVYGVNNPYHFSLNDLHFNTAYHKAIYSVESPDAINPIGDGCKTILRYKENNKSAGIAYDGSSKIVVLGFPFETITDFSQSKNIMQEIMLFLTSKNQ